MPTYSGRTKISQRVASLTCLTTNTTHQSKLDQICDTLGIVILYDKRIGSQGPSYKRNLFLKKTILVLNCLMVNHFNLDLTMEV